MSDYDLLKMVTGLIAKQDREYLVKCGNDQCSYLNQDTDDGDYFLNNKVPSKDFKTHFTISEIIEAVKSDNIYLDWSRVELEEVKDDGRNENE